MAAAATARGSGCAQPLVSYRVIVELISATTTKPNPKLRKVSGTRCGGEEA